MKTILNAQSVICILGCYMLLSSCIQELECIELEPLPDLHTDSSFFLLKKEPDPIIFSPSPSMPKLIPSRCYEIMDVSDSTGAWQEL